MKSLSMRGALSACLISGAAVVALAAPGAASAGGLTEQCSGAAELKGQGSTLQAEAVGVWAVGFNANATSLKACNGKEEVGKKTSAEPLVTYKESSSGKGFKAWTVNKEFGAYGFIGTDNTVNNTEKGEIEADGTAETGGKALTIPVAEGAVAIIINLPNGCHAESTAAKGRLSLSDLQVEEVYAGVITKWSGLTGVGGSKIIQAPAVKVLKVKTTTGSAIVEVASGGFPEVAVGDPVSGTGIPVGTTVLAITGNTAELSANATKTSTTGVTLSFTPPTCEPEETIKTVARKDGSGTTHIFKRWLHWSNEGTLTTPVDGAQTWNQLSEGSESTEWPTGVPTIKEEGSPALVTEVATTPSTIGYANLADARNAANGGGFGEKQPGDGGEKHQKFWALVENGEKESKPTFTDPSSDKESGTRANANCTDTVFSNGLASFPPPSVESNWNEVTADKFSKTYPICGLTYDLALANYEAYDAFGTTQGEATDVENYLAFVLDSKGGQKEIITKHDYEDLPKAVLTKSLEGLPLITWEP
jgi:ABC-type phosphate transport system substrate-binding protein